MAPTSKYSKQQLMKHLKILDSLPSELLPPTLPPSPPASRSASPAPPPTLNGKRKPSSRSRSPSPAAKRHRPGSADESRSSPRETSGASSSRLSPPAFTVDPTPKRPPPALQELREANVRMQDTAKTLKRSGELRIQRVGHSRSSAIPPAADQREYLIGHLELYEGVLAFVYAFWLQDMVAVPPYQHKEDRLHVAANWSSIGQLLHFARDRWERLRTGPALALPLGDHGEARIGALCALCHLLEGFILSITSRAHARRAEGALGPLLESAASSPASQQPTPTPGATQQPTPPGAGNSPRPEAAVPVPELRALLSALQSSQSAQAALARAAESRFLALGAIERAFPRTWARVHAGARVPVGAADEFAVGWDDAPGRCQLSWPVAPTAAPGRGVGAVVVLARAMLDEFGADPALKYEGLKGVLRTAPAPRP